MRPSVMMRAVTKSPPTIGLRHASSAMMRFEQAVESLPMREAGRFKAKNLKWTAKDYKSYADSHANALLEFRFTKGDKIAVWMAPCDHKHVCLLAYAKMGMHVYDIDPAISSVADVRAFLTESQCKMVVFPPVTENQDNLRLLRYAIPELFEYSNEFGQHFHSKHFPKLKYFVHTGFDIEVGTVTFKSLFFKDPPVSKIDKEVNGTSDDLACYTKISAGKGGSGIVVGPTRTHKDLLEVEELSFIKNIIENRYFET